MIDCPTRAGRPQTPDDIDIDALREKYLHERDKRLRPEGSKQYLELEDEFAEFYEVDPHTPVTPRTPIDARHRRRGARAAASPACWPART